MTTPDAEADAGTEANPTEDRSRWRALVLVALAAAGAIAAGTVIARVTEDEPVSTRARVEQAAASERYDYDFVVPEGMVDRLAAGESIEVVPAALTVKVGQTLRIRNQDVRPVRLGPFAVGPLQTLTQRFATPGVLEGECNVHASGKIVITVER